MRIEQKISKQWKKYHSDSENEMDLIDFLLHDWSINLKHDQQLNEKEFYKTIRDEAHFISSVHGLSTCSKFQELSSKQEEADTRIFL